MILFFLRFLKKKSVGLIILKNDIDLLQKLPGIGRKSANVIVSVVFNKPALAVDTHVFRVANRIGLAKNAKTPRQVEDQLVKFFPDELIPIAHQLVKFFPDELIPIAHHWLILHGRYVCMARKPKCEKCGLANVCFHYNMGKK